MLTPDICVIGAGSGGLSVAAAAAAFGVPVVLVERGAMGGDCLNFGCVPSKSLIAAAHHAEAVRRAERFGIRAGAPAVDFAAVHAHVRSVIEAIAPHDSAERFSALGVQVIRAQARFLDPRTVEAGGRQIRARRFVVAAGSAPLVPDIPGLADVPFLTNETVFEHREGFGHLLVIGAGPVGLELAQAYRRLGCAVTVLSRGRALAREDPEMAAVPIARLRAEGVDLRENVEVRAVEATAAGLRVRVSSRETGEAAVEGTHLLVAAGRRPNTAGLGLDEAGIRFGPDGIAVSPSLRTGNRRVYAIGDVAAGQPRFTHAASHGAGLAIRAILFRLPVRFDAGAIPRVTYCDPELAHAGLSESEAREKGIAHSVVRAAFADNDRARAGAETAGGIKIVAGRRGRILGASIAGARAGELIHLWSFAIAGGKRLSDVAGAVAPYPTLGEIGKRGAYAYLSPAAGNSWVRRLVRFLRAWG